jgi:hydrogenase maturation protein HypF
MSATLTTSPLAKQDDSLKRLHIQMHGAVQGVGFRPTVYRIAQSLRLSGWVRNTPAGLDIEIEGPIDLLDRFLALLQSEQPRAAVLHAQIVSRISPMGGSCFEILLGGECSTADYVRSAAVSPDIATCSDCLADLADTGGRRFSYPFTNCTNCGPRYSILLDIPYDRPNTTMRVFALCSACQREYDSSADRRFHAQPNACSVCGPRLLLEEPSSASSDSLSFAVEALRDGKIVAIKGIGGFQLLVDARNPIAVLRLRKRKQREEKPFAVLMPSLDVVKEYCVVSEQEEVLLTSSAAPIVLLQRKPLEQLALEVATSSSSLGVMLPYSPLHHLLMKQYPFPVVATSGNQANEPIAIENDEGLERLKNIADIFLLHNRRIVRPCDDSVAHIVRKLPQVIRRARGFAPLPLVLPFDLPPVLAVGGHLKNTVAISIGKQVVLSQHIGDLDSVESRSAFERAIDDLCRLYRFKPELIVCDLHPDYASTKWARAFSQDSGVPIKSVQHHHAHLAACAAENEIETDYLGVAWDGAGLGLDGGIWGGEFFRVSGCQFERIAHLRPFQLPGGEAAMRDCSRPAASLLFGTYSSSLKNEHVSATSIEPGLWPMLAKNIQSPMTTSIGRLFDGVAYLIGVAKHNRFEGEAASRLEDAIGSLKTTDGYAIESKQGIGDWASLIDALLADKKNGVSESHMAGKFHNALAFWILDIARTTNLRDVVLSGGVFQNAYLATCTSTLLEQNGFRVLTHHKVPPNDGGLSLGQAALARQWKA